MKKIIALILAAALLLALSGCGAQDKPADETSEGVTYAGNPQVQITMEDGGIIVMELYPEFAPLTVQNFLKLVNDGFYDGLTFHRVIDDFMAQGGDPNGNGSGGSPDTIFGEFSNNGYTQNTLSHTRGVVSMARQGNDMNSASSQFFICYSDSCTFLDGDYASFAKVISGMEVVDSFLEVERTMGSDGNMSTPVTPIVMKEVKVISGQ